MIYTSSLGTRLLLLADGASAPPPSLTAGWDVLTVDSLAHARFLQQFDPFDVVLVDHCKATEADRDNLGCLTLPSWTSLVVLSDEETEAPPPQVGHGPQHWLPRRPVLEYPSMLAVVLNQAAHISKLRRLLQRLEKALQASHSQANRLIELLWQGLPAEGRSPLLTQRRVLERLEEEVARSRRYAAPLSLVLGELDGGPAWHPDGPEHAELTGWAAKKIGRTKRRCDVAGQYGPNGFLLLLPQTTDEGANSYCRRLLTLLDKAEEMPEGVETPPRIRLAAATLPSAAVTAQSLLSQAEERLMQACQQF